MKSKNDERKNSFCKLPSIRNKRVRQAEKTDQNIARETNHTPHLQTTAGRYDIRTVSPLPCVFFSDLAHLFAFKKAGLFTKNGMFYQNRTCFGDAMTRLLSRFCGFRISLSSPLEKFFTAYFISRRHSIQKSPERNRAFFEKIKVNGFSKPPAYPYPSSSKKPALR